MVISRAQVVRGWSGFTLIELMVTLVLVAVIAMLAAPSFTETIAAHRVRSAASDLQAALVLTRSEALKRNLNVMLDATDGWTGAWTLKSIAPDGTVTAVGHFDPVTGAGISEANSLSFVTYRPNGRLSGAGSPDFTITATGALASAVKCLKINLSGMPYFVRVSDDGTCP